MMRSCLSSWALFFFVSIAFAETPASAPEAPADKPYAGPIEEIRLEPTAIDLKDQLDAARILVSGRTPDGQWVDLTRVATVEIVSPEKFKPESAIVTRDADGFFIPVADGQATAAFSFGGKRAEAKVAVSGVGQERPISFVRDVIRFSRKPTATPARATAPPRARTASSFPCAATIRSGTTNNW